MIKRLKIRFIALAMVSLTILLAAIVTGMNLMNYSKVVSDADSRLEVLEQNSERIFAFKNGAGVAEEGLPVPPAGDDAFFGRRGPGGPSMTRDEAEESRFFTVILSDDGKVRQANIDRISSVDAAEAGDYAEEAAASGESSGFIGDFRYSVSESGNGKMVTFLDCGRVLDSYRDFLRASIIMSLAGLLVVFAAMVYFAGRIVRPVAESYEKQKRFITDAGHEIKTPLAIIKANLDLIGMDPCSAEESLSDISAQVDRLSGLTNDLVYLSRMEEAGGGLVMADVLLSDAAEEAAAAFAPLAGDSGKTIEADIEPLISVRGSLGELEKLLSIILENAVKYSPSGGTVRLSLKREGRNAVLTVANPCAQPVSDESLAHVFDRFYRADSSRNSASGGHGIGLSMASAIAAAHKGRISARTTDGSDFIITATIPLA